MIDKQKVRRLENGIRQISLKFWDPIGIKEEPLVPSEYGMYIGGILSFLVKNASDEVLNSHLWRIIEERVQIHPRRGVTDETVKALRKIRLS